MSETGIRKYFRRLRHQGNNRRQDRPLNWKREIAEWAAILLFFFLLYITGLHTTVIGSLQRIILETGIFKAKTLEEPIQIREDLLLADLNGLPVGTLSEFRGKVVFLNIWATWCPPCVAEMPDLQRLYDRVQNEHLVYIFLSSDEDPETVRHFMGKRDLKLPVYFPASPLPYSLRTRVIPSTFIIDHEGRIVMQKEGMAKYNTRSFRSALKELTDAAEGAAL